MIIVIVILDEIPNGNGPGDISAGTWGEFIDVNGNNVKNNVLDQLKVAETKVQEAINGLAAQAARSAEANKAKLTTVKTAIDTAKQKVEEIQTGADFKNLNTASGKGKQAVDALNTVNTEANTQLENPITYGSDKTITKEDITTHIDAAIDKFNDATTNGVGQYTTPNTTSPQSRSPGVFIPEGGNKTSAKGGENFYRGKFHAPLEVIPNSSSTCLHLRSSCRQLLQLPPRKRYNHSRRSWQ